MLSLKNKLLTLENSIIKFLSSKIFFWVVIALFIMQSLWIAFSIRFPMLFDEFYHFGVIKVFSGHLSPIIVNQPVEYDIYGNLTFGNASIFHYLLSFPFRLISFITQDQTIQIIFLRVINILLAASGLIVFARLFKAIDIKQIYINLSLFFFSLITIVTFVSATISYDNLLFLLTPWFLLLGVRILRSKTISVSYILQFIIVGLFASLIKFTFLPIFVAGVLFVFLVVFKKHGKALPNKLLKSINKITKFKSVLLVSLLIIFGSIFTIRYITPTIKYGSPIPDCGATLSVERCRVGYVYDRDMRLKATKAERYAEPPQQYILSWLKSQLTQLDTSAALTPHTWLYGKPMPVFSFIMSTLAYICSIAILLNLYRIKKNINCIFITTMALVLIFTVFIFNILSYYSAHIDLNVQVRYLLSIFPVFMVMSMVALSDLIGHRRHVKVLILIAVLLFSTQGGGIIKPIINADSNWYWQNTVIIETNKDLKNILSPLVKE